MVALVMRGRDESPMIWFRLRTPLIDSAAVVNGKSVPKSNLCVTLYRFVVASGRRLGGVVSVFHD